MCLPNSETTHIYFFKGRVQWVNRVFPTLTKYRIFVWGGCLFGKCTHECWSTSPFICFSEKVSLKHNIVYSSPHPLKFLYLFFFPKFSLSLLKIKGIVNGSFTISLTILPLFFSFFEKLKDYIHII